MKKRGIDLIIIIILFCIFPIFSCSKSDQPSSKKGEMSVEEAKNIIKQQEEKQILEQAKAIKQEDLNQQQRKLDQVREALRDTQTCNFRAAAALAYADAAVNGKEKNLNVNSVLKMIGNPNPKEITVEPQNKIKANILGKMYIWEFTPPANISLPIEGQTMRQAKDMAQKELDQLPNLGRQAVLDGITCSLYAAASIVMADAAVNGKEKNLITIRDIYKKLIYPHGVTMEAPNKFKVKVEDKNYIWVFTPPINFSKPKPE